MNDDRRNVRDPFSDRPAGASSLLAQLNETLVPGNSAKATVDGTGMKIRVRHLFEATSGAYPSGSKVYVTEVQGTLRAFLTTLGSGAGGDGCNCCDARDCVDHGSIFDCDAVGAAGSVYFCEQLALPTPYCSFNGTHQSFTHAGGCLWETPTVGCGEDVYKWRLDASGTFAYVDLVHLSGPTPMTPAIRYVSLKPFSGLCPNEFWLHTAPGPTWSRNQEGWRIGDGWNGGIANRICLSQPYIDCAGEPVPQYYSATINLDLSCETDPDDGNVLGALTYHSGGHPEWFLGMNGTHVAEVTTIQNGCIYYKDFVFDDGPNGAFRLTISPRANRFSVYPVVSMNSQVFGMQYPTPKNVNYGYWSSRTAALAVYWIVGSTETEWLTECSSGSIGPA